MDAKPSVAVGAEFPIEVDQVTFSHVVRAVCGPTGGLETVESAGAGHFVGMARTMHRNLAGQSSRMAQVLIADLNVIELCPLDALTFLTPDDERVFVPSRAALALVQR